MACRTGCPTQDHQSWGECARASNMRIAYCASHIGNDRSAQKKSDRDLAEYASARKQGVQPRSTKINDVRQAMDLSNRTGVAFDAGV